MSQMFKQRQFLNDQSNDSNAYISVGLTDDYGELQYEITITDCEKKIRIHECINSGNALNKLDILIKNLTDLKRETQQLQMLEKVTTKKYSTRELAQQAADDIKDHYLLIQISHQIKVKEVRKKFVIYRDHKAKFVQG